MDMVRAALRLRSGSMIWAFHDISEPEWFERCIDEISSERDVIALEEVAQNPGRRKACAVTFDDGLKSVLDIAHPILSERSLPYTVFVCTDVIAGGPVPWFLRIGQLIDLLGSDRVCQHWRVAGRRLQGKTDAIAALKEIPLDAVLDGIRELEEQYTISPPHPSGLFLSMDEVRWLATAGATIGSHTHRHPILSTLSARDQRDEVEKSARLIEKITGRRPLEFAYPNGTPLDFDSTTIAVLRASGTRLAVTTIQRHLKPSDDLFALPRIGLGDGHSRFRRVCKSAAPALSASYFRERRVRSRLALSERSKR
jgi:peptidoglycan/xylan/chitin deacetylase (PgdA/CDA1 family)